jgi:hypothetical protein
MTSRWLPDGPPMCLSSACTRGDHSGCESATRGICGCLCHLRGGQGIRDHGQD